MSGLEWGLVGVEEEGAGKAAGLELIRRVAVGLLRASYVEQMHHLVITVAGTGDWK
jgi:hypothetical protein